MDSLHWTVLTVGWRSVVGAMFAFIGAALGSAGGIGGGTIFVPMANIILGFDSKSSVASSKCMILGAAISTVAYNFFTRLRNHDTPLVDYHLGFLMMPMLLLGISIGVKLNLVFPGWLITTILVIVAIVTGTRVLYKAIKAWADETNRRREQISDKNPLRDDQAPSNFLDILQKNLSWTIVAMVLVWTVFLVLEIIQIHTQTCSSRYWIFNLLQVPLAVIAFLVAAVKVYNHTRNEERHVLKVIVISAIGSTIGGTVAGMVGLGGGFILGPILLEFGVHPQIASATATFIMLFSSSLAVVEYYLLHRFPIPYASFLSIVTLVGGAVGQHFVQKLVKTLRRPSIIVFILCFLTLLSALLLGGLGIKRTIHDWKAGEHMGLRDLC